jgi:hypothetical protein
VQHVHTVRFAEEAACAAAGHQPETVSRDQGEDRGHHLFQEPSGLAGSADDEDEGEITLGLEEAVEENDAPRRVQEIVKPGVGLRAPAVGRRKSRSGFFGAGRTQALEAGPQQDPA